MAGQNDALVMAAEIVDKFSKPLKDMQRSLRSLAAETTQTHKLGQVQAKTHTEQLYKLRREVNDVADRLKSGLAPAMSTLGISSLSAATGIGAVAAAMKEFASTSRHLTLLSRNTQLSVNELRVLEALAPRIGTSVEDMDTALSNFNSNMEKLRRAPLAVLRETFQALHVRPDPQVVAGWRNLIASLQGLPRAQQLGKIVEYLSKIRDISQKGVVLEAFGLPKAFANLSPAELQKQLDAIKKILTPLTPEQVARGVEAQDTIDNLVLSLQNLRDVVGAEFAGDMKKAADALTQFVSVHSDDIIAALREIAHWLKEQDWKAFADDVRTAAGVVNQIAESMGGWKTVIEGVIALKLAGWLFGILTPLRGVATVLTTIVGLGSAPAWIMSLLGLAGAAAADKDRQKRGPNAPGGLYGTPLFGFDPTTGAPIEVPQGRARGDAGPTGGIGNLPSGAAPAQRPLWRRLFDFMNDNEGALLHKSAFQVPGDWAGKLSGGGSANDARGLEGIIERGTLQALRDFADEQKLGGGGGGGGGGITRAAFSPSGTGGFGSGAGGGAGTGGGYGTNGGSVGSPGGVTNAPMGRLPRLNELPGPPDTPAAPGKEGAMYDPITATGLGGGVGDNRGNHIHAGDDILAPHGSPVYAAKNGTIVSHNPHGTMQGDAATRIKWDDGSWSYYMHHALDPNLKVGSRVQGGQQIGTSGTANGVPHLHFEYHKNGQTLSPRRVFGWDKQHLPHGGQFANNSAIKGFPHFTTKNIDALRGSVGGTGAGASGLSDRRAGFADELRDPATGTPGRWSHEQKPPHFDLGDIRNRLQGAGIGTPASAGTSDVKSALREGSSASDVDLPHLKAMASIESSFNPSSNFNRRTQYKGLFQIGRSEWAEYLQHGGKGNIYNAHDNAMAMAYLVNRNREDFRKHFGRDPTPGEIYMMHQQGLGFYTRGAMTNISGNPYPGMRGPQSHGSFEAGWTRELEKRAGRYGPDDETKAAIAMHGDVLRRHFGVGQRGQKSNPDLLGAGQRAGLVGPPMQHKVTGSANISVDFKNMPRGVVPGAKADGMFKEVKLNRGRALPPASQEA